MDTNQQKGGTIRAAVDRDLEGICALDARVYPNHKLTPARVGFMNEVLFTHPWRTDRLPSLVYEDEEGRIRGFLGIMPRRMLLNGQPLLAGISHRFMVDPEMRGSLAALGLMKTFLTGGHDLSITEPENEAARRIWLRYGGFAVESQSFQWTRPIRPAGWAAQFVNERLPGLARWMVGGIAGGVDTVAGAVAGVRPKSDARTVELTPETMQEVLNAVSANYSLRPVYELQELKWFLERLAAKHGRGTLRARLVQPDSGQGGGYYVYYAKPKGTGLVVQICAPPAGMKAVWRSLAADAWDTGTVALRGKYDAMAASLGDRTLLVKRARHTFLLHTRHVDVERALLRGDALVTRLEGEGGIPFGDDRVETSADAADGP